MSSERILFREVCKQYYRGPGAPLLVNWRKALRPADGDWFYALRQVNLTCGPGTCLGIIGTNGSGKTTLLRIIAGVTNPTSGTVSIRGRVVPLLEASAGMQPDLTGRENIYLNGILLGMRRREIRRKLDSIVHFAGIADFLDTPLKHYSSGMHIRLGFSVASHVEGAIYLVDEVWSIADAAFQRTTLDRLLDIRRAGGTILLVSHDLEIARRLSDQILWLDRGRVIDLGRPAAIVERYLKSAYQAP